MSKMAETSEAVVRKVTLYDDFAGSLMRSTQLEDAINGICETIAEEARRRSRWGNGTIAKGIRVTTGIQKGQLVGRVNAMDFKSHWFQFGTSKMTAKPFLTDAAQACGFKIEAGRKHD